MLLLLLTFLIRAGAAPCVASLVLAEDEQKLSEILHRMHQIKLGETTEESLQVLRELNSRALGVMKQRLDRRGFVTRITAAAQGMVPLEAADVRPQWNARLREVEEELRSLELVRPVTFASRAELERKIDFARSEIRNLARRSAPSRAALAHDGTYGLRHAFAEPMIALDGPTLPEPLRQATRFGKPIVLSPHYRSLAPNVRASVHADHLFYAIEQVFSPDFGADRILRHESIHLELGENLERGVPRPYYVNAQARSGFEFPVEPRTRYHDRIDFSELLATEEDLRNVEADEAAGLARLYRGGRVYVHGPLARVRYDLADQLWKISRLCDRILDQLRATATETPDLVRFEVGEDRTIVLVPWFNRGVRVADLEVHLLGLGANNQAYRFNHLHHYLDLVREAVRGHEAYARSVLAEYGGVVPEGEVWVEVKRFDSR